MHLSIQNFSKDLSSYQKLSTFITPPPSVSLYASLIYHKETNSLYFAAKDSQTFFPFEVEGDIDDEAADKDFGVKIDPSNLFYIFDIYAPEVLSQLVISFSQDSDDTDGTMPISVFIKSPSDSIQIPCSTMDSDDVMDILNLIEANTPNTSESITLSLSENYDVLRGINESLGFMGSDDSVHNAVAIHANKVTYNDRRHIFIYDLVDGALSSVTGYIPVHKKPARVIDYLYNKAAEFKAYVSLKGSFVWIVYGTGVMKFNNSLSNIAPPTEAILKDLTPTNKFCDTSLLNLQSTSSFFTGFFQKTDAWKLLTLKLDRNKIEFMVGKSSTSASSCTANRMYDVDTEEHCDMNLIKEEINIINDSLLAFLRLHKSKQDATVSLCIDDSKNGVLVTYSNKRILLPKMKISK